MIGAAREGLSTRTIAERYQRAFERRFYRFIGTACGRERVARADSAVIGAAANGSTETAETKFFGFLSVRRKSSTRNVHGFCGGVHSIPNFTERVGRTIAQEIVPRRPKFLFPIHRKPIAENPLTH